MACVGRPSIRRGLDERRARGNPIGETEERERAPRGEHVFSATTSSLHQRRVPSSKTLSDSKEFVSDPAMICMGIPMSVIIVGISSVSSTVRTLAGPLQVMTTDPLEESYRSNEATLNAKACPHVIHYYSVRFSTCFLLLPNQHPTTWYSMFLAS